ncbi:MAG TPA: glycosyltransferase family 2 protein [Candidatus Angelobacter sp.]|nr:glycosyltransferase family 2 protein [Candidatus Angelobacter sp.]
MADATPVVSIGMPVYNCESTVALSIRSVQKQTFTDWELIVIDDGSSDRTADVVLSFRDPRIRLIADGTNRRLAKRLNEAVALARGKFFARMDGDDVAFPHRLESQLRFLRDHPNVDLLGGQHIVFRGDGEFLGIIRQVSDHDSICGSLISGFTLSHPTWFGERGWFLKHPYNVSCRRAQDRELLLRAHRDSRFAALEEYIHGYREDGVYLSKTMAARLAFLKYGASDMLRHREYARVSVFAAIQVAKMAFDAAAVASGLKYKMLRHRALPAPVEVRRQWEEVWKEISEN